MHTYDFWFATEASGIDAALSALDVGEKKQAKMSLSRKKAVASTLLSLLLVILASDIPILTG